MAEGGRGVRNRKARVDEARSLDILKLQRRGVFARNYGCSYISSWSRGGDTTDNISFSVELNEENPSALRFVYSINDNETETKRDYRYLIPVTATRCHFGGRRWWFVCPLKSESCLGRCRIIYLPPDAEYFGCRECHQLTYESRQRHREMFYERFEKPYNAIAAAKKEMARTRSINRKEKCLLNLAKAYEAINHFNNMSFR